MLAFVDAGQPVLVARYGARVVGFALGECTTGRLAICHILVVEERYRGRGIGSALLRQFEEQVVGWGASHVLLYGDARSTHTIRFFRRSGYRLGNLVREMSKRLSRIRVRHTLR
jgi:GNAT superfamily N-acetyltransferase